LQNHKEPDDRGKSGAWILDTDLASCFDYVQIYYNPKVFKNLKSDYYACEKEKTSTFKPESEVIVLEEIKLEDSHSEATLVQGGSHQSGMVLLGGPQAGGQPQAGSNLTLAAGPGNTIVASPSVPCI
jgi:hypothetical protein